MSAFATLFSGPPKPPPLPKMTPVVNTALTAQLQAIARRQGAGSTILSSPGGTSTGPVGSHTLTGQ